MDITFRPPTDPEEAAAFVAFDAANFHDGPSEPAVFDAAARARTRVGHDRGTLVAGGRVLDLAITPPGGPPVPAGGLAWISVTPTHRRRGLLRALVAELVADVRAHGETLALLTASEGGIYRRFGFGLTTRALTLEVDRSRAALLAEAAPGPDDVAARCRFVAADEALIVAPHIYDAVRATRNGMVARPESSWRGTVQGRDDPQGAERRVAVHRGAAGDDGYVVSTGASSWQDTGGPSGTLRVHELLATDPRATRTLWTLAIGVDLVTTVTARNRPVDDPLPATLADPRACRVVEARDAVWVRVLDVARALAARRSLSEGAVTLEVVAPEGDPAGGRWRWESGPHGASCARTTAPADVRVGVAELGPLLFAGTSCRRLAAAGLVDGSPSALDRADARFAWPDAPWSVAWF